MSEHYYDTLHNGRPVTVTLGWDKALECYYLDIALLDAPNGPCYLYSYIHEERPFELSLDHFRERLEGLDLAIPDRMFEEVQKQRCPTNGRDYRFFIHHADGTMEAT